VNDNVRHRLHQISIGAEMTSRHARALPYRPPYTTAAQDELQDAEQALEAALQKVRDAMAEYNSKPLQTV
jgi:hypothetical protein